MSSARAARRHPGRQFADLYEGNSLFDATHYRNAGAPFIVLKASQGTEHRDSKHKLRADLAHEVDLPVGHYHYLDSSNPRLQAALFWDMARAAWRPSDFLIVDVERGAGIKNPHDQLNLFDAAVHQLAGRLILGYTELSYLHEHLLEVKSRKWWVADYGANPRQRDMPFGQELWAHQFTSAGTMAGTEHPVDLSVLVAPSAIRWWDK